METGRIARLLAALALPAADALPASDDVRALYREFIGQLEPVAGGRAVVSNPWFLNWAEWPEPPATRTARLSLSAMLTRAVDPVPLLREPYCRDTYEWWFDDADTVLAAPGACRGSSLATFHVVDTVTIHCDSDCEAWQVSAWTDRWAAVYRLTPSGPGNGIPFVALLGFCRRGRTAENFVSLLRAGSARYDPGFYDTYGDVYGPWPRAVEALQAPEEV